MTGSHPPSEELLTSETLLGLLQRYGRSSYSFHLLYGGFRLFRDPGPGAIAYVSTPFAWIAAAEPLAADEDLPQLLDRFVAAARARRKQAVFLPVGEKVARVAESRGLRAWPIGLEPWKRLSPTEFERKERLRGLASARALLAKGAKVEAFNPLEITPHDRIELDGLVQRWLRSRRSAPLAFLNRLNIWRLPEHKRYFSLRYHGHFQGLVAAVPILATRGWYLVDLIRDPGAPPGTTEFLVDEASRSLQAEGATEVTLGLAPLAGAPWSRSRGLYPRLARLAYERCDFLYSFQPLYAFKAKFAPDRWDTLYLVSSGGVGPGTLYCLLKAHYPGGIARAGLDTALRLLRRLDPVPFLQDQLSPGIVARSMPRSFTELSYRIYATLLIGLVNMMFFLVTSNGTRIRHWVAMRYAYSWAALWHTPEWSQQDATNGFRALLISPFLHWDLIHIGFNLLTLLLFGGLLEVLAGTVMLSVVFLMGILFSNLLTSVAGIAVLSALRALGAADSEVYHRFVSEPDIGCSLGVFAAIGALCWFLRHPKLFAAVWAGGVILYAVLSAHPLDLNHLAAMLLGYLIARRYVPVN